MQKEREKESKEKESKKRDKRERVHDPGGQTRSKERD
jgi:hypothetical protein